MAHVDVHVVSQTHWDREWYATREQFRIRLVDLVDRVLDLMDAEPRFESFHLDAQTIVLEDYLEVRPEQEERLRPATPQGAFRARGKRGIDQVRVTTCVLTRRFGGEYDPGPENRLSCSFDRSREAVDP